MSVRHVYWKEDDMWLGYLEEFPDSRARANQRLPRIACGRR
ncbi:MAG: hypothetical protein ACRD1R_20945 [Acidobacteriota bacterium]